jgi:hypothetical protein
MKKLVIIGLTLLASGCAQYVTHYQPTVDLAMDPNASSYNRDMQDCKLLAEQSNGVGDAAVGGLTGALIGGAGGAALGAVIGNPAVGAAIGGAAGGIGGATYSGMNADGRYKRFYSNCMRGRRHPVID